MGGREGRISFTDIVPLGARRKLGTAGALGVLGLGAVAACDGTPTTNIDCTVPSSSSYIGNDIPAGHIDVKASSAGVFFAKLGGGEDVLTSSPYGSTFVIGHENIQEVGVGKVTPASRPKGVLGVVSTVPITGSIDQVAFAGCAANPLDAEARLRAEGATVFAIDYTGVRQVSP